MKIYLNAFHITDLCPRFSLDLFEQNLPAFEEFQLSKRSRVLAAAREGKYLVGLLVSTTYTNKELYLGHDANGRVVLRIGDLPTDEEKTVFNYFCINVETGVGLVSRYFSAGSVTTFGNLLRSRYKSKLREFYKLTRDELLESEIEFDRAALWEEFKKGEFLVTPIYRKGTFEARLKELSVIADFTYDEPNVKEPKYTAVRDELELDRRYLKFKTASPEGRLRRMAATTREKIIEFIADTVVSKNVPRATVRGRDREGHDLPPITLSPDIDSFGDYEYNTVVVKENLVLDQIATVPFIREMLRIARANKGTFETPKKR